MSSAELTSTEELEDYGYEDCTLAVTLLCKQVGGIKRVKDGIPIANSRFLTSDNQAIQVCGWRDIAEVVSGLKPDHVYSLSPITKTSSKRFGELLLGYELTVHSATQITDLGSVVEDDAASFVTLAESCNVEGKIVMRAYIQNTPFEYKGNFNFALVYGPHRVPAKCQHIEEALSRGDMVEATGRYSGRTFVADKILALAEEPLADDDPQLRSVRPPPRQIA